MIVYFRERKCQRTTKNERSYRYFSARSFSMNVGIWSKDSNSEKKTLDYEYNFIVNAKTEKDAKFQVKKFLFERLQRDELLVDIYGVEKYHFIEGIK